MKSVIRIYLLYLQTVLIAAGPGAQYRMQVSNMFTVNFMVSLSKFGKKHMAATRV